MIENKYKQALEQIWGSESYRVTLMLSTIGNLYAECDFTHDRRRLTDSNYRDVLNDMFYDYCVENAILNGSFVMNSLDKIFASMRSGKYVIVIDPKGNAHVGIINAIMREDGSGKNWIVTLTKRRTVSEQVFIYAS